VDPSNLLYNQTVRTGGGVSLAAPVKLPSLSVDGVKVANVDALVIGRGLPTSLLGMTYLGRLSKFEATPTSLVLNP
jgi:aspartyl protease family protein